MNIILSKLTFQYQHQVDKLMLVVQLILDLVVKWNLLLLK